MVSISVVNKGLEISFHSLVSETIAQHLLTLFDLYYLVAYRTRRTTKADIAPQIGSTKICSILYNIIILSTYSRIINDT